MTVTCFVTLFDSAPPRHRQRHAARAAGCVAVTGRDHVAGRASVAERPRTARDADVVGGSARVEGAREVRAARAELRHGRLVRRRSPFPRRPASTCCSTVRPPSVTVSVTVYTPAVAHVFFTVGRGPRLACARSPQSHLYDTIPSSSVDADRVERALERRARVQVKLRPPADWFVSALTRASDEAHVEQQVRRSGARARHLPRHRAADERRRDRRRRRAADCPARYSAATPATCGDAIDVPLSTRRLRVASVVRRRDRLARREDVDARAEVGERRARIGARRRRRR